MGNITPESIVNDLRYLQLLSRSFPTIADASTEIINLEAILNLPKGTEHFLTDIHGEYEALQHMLKSLILAMYITQEKLRALWQVYNRRKIDYLPDYILT